MKNEQIYYHTLDNGIRIVHCRTQSPVSWVGIMVDAGTRDEQPDLNGMAHYIEHCVFKGTTTRSAKQIINRIEDVGGEINAYTTKEETAFYAAVPTRHYERAAELIADIVFHPCFPEKETTKELGVIADEIESYEDSPSELIYDDFEALVFAGNSLEMPVLGTKKTLKRIDQTAVRQFLTDNYCTSSMVFFSLSSLPVNKVVAIAERYLNNTDYKKFCTNQRIAPMPSDSHYTHFRRHTHQTHLMLGGRAYPLGHEKQLALYLLNNILGGGSMNSRLNMSLREQRGLVYTIESTYTPLSDTGYWCVYCASEPQNTDLCRQLIMDELNKLTDAPLSTYSLRKALNQLRGQLTIASQNQENNALRIARLTLRQAQAPSLKQTLAAIEQLTPEFLLQTAREIYNETNLYTLKYI